VAGDHPTWKDASLGFNPSITTNSTSGSTSTTPWLSHHQPTLGQTPPKTNNFIGDWAGACLSATAVLIAFPPRRTGRGQLVDFAQSEGLIRLLDWTGAFIGMTGRDRAPLGNLDVAMSPAAIFPSRNGPVAIAAPLDHEFRRVVPGDGTTRVGN
jgi:crotonobetainyl-CoA:carnitine CoA-transferase CaiB-like acyl-CoA transferase